MKRQVPLLITLFVGTLLMVSVFIPPLQSMQENSTLFFDIIAVFAYFLGGGNLLRIHLQRIARRRQDWAYSIVTLTGFAMMLSFGLFKIGNPGGITANVTAAGSWFQTSFENVLNPLSSTMYS